MNEFQEFETARFYTRSRKYPKVIGRFNDGTRIPGGPYTVTQAAIGGSVALIALTTRAEWGSGSILLDIPVSLAVSWAAAWGAGRIPATRRNLLTVVVGAFSAAFRPAEGRYRERSFRTTRPHYAAGKVAIAAVTLPGTDRPTMPAPSAPPAPAALPTPAAPRQLEPATTKRPVVVTGVERLLQQSRSK
jgi:hypothetical protein